MKVKILSPTKQIFEGDAAKITLPAVDGEITILPHHISIITALGQGRITVHRVRGDNFSTEISSGICSFSNECASVLLDS